MKKLMLFAVLGLTTFSSLSALAQDVPVATPAIVPTLITPSHVDPNGKVPTINGVPGAGVANLDIGFPVGALVNGQVYVYVLGMTDVSFTGTCTLSYKLTQVQAGKTVTLDSNTKNLAVSPGDWAWAWNGKAIPNSPGLATLTGSLKYGTATTSIHSAVWLQ